MAKNGSMAAPHPNYADRGGAEGKSLTPMSGVLGITQVAREKIRQALPTACAGPERCSSSRWRDVQAVHQGVGLKIAPAIPSIKIVHSEAS